MKSCAFYSFFILLPFSVFCQWNPSPTDSRLLNTKLSSFPSAPNNIYLFEIKKDTAAFDMIVTLNKCEPDIQFFYKIPEKLKEGNILITSEAKRKATKYLTEFESFEDSIFTNKSALWLSNNNMTELLLLKETTMDMGNGMEIFYKRKTSILKINYKGKEKIITVFNIENSGAKGKIQFAVLSDQRNAMIVKFDAPFSMLLKEVR